MTVSTAVHERLSSWLYLSIGRLIRAAAVFGSSGVVDFQAGNSIDLTNTIVNARSLLGFNGGNITMAAPRISISGSALDAQSSSIGHGGTSGMTGQKALSLTDSRISADNTLIPPFPISPPNSNGGTIIHIDGGGKLTSQQSTLSAQSVLGNGGTIHIEAPKVGLTDTQVTISVSGGVQRR